jgi:glyoxylase-like metal-dependent hydrolase (beta-lactamase superfamily II)
MKEWEVKVLYFGKISANLSYIWPTMNPPLASDVALGAPYLGFLLRSRDRVILVDTGINEKFIVDGKAWGALPAEGGSRFVKEALKKEGLKPEDIETVVLTHLHNDHAGNCGVFPNARILCQRDEWTNLLSPYPQQLVRKDYDQDIVPELKQMKLVMIDGDYSVDDGVDLYKVPGGHSLGSQVVVVNTKKGGVVLMGDISLFNFMAFPETTELVDMEGKGHPIPAASPLYGPAVPHPVIYDLFSFYNGMSTIRALAARDEPGYLIPGHEPSLVFSGI